MIKLKEFFVKIIVWFIKFLNKIYNRLNTKSKESNPYNFEDLTPRDDVDKDNQYANAINWALENENIKNIALSGPYGSGKSSILKTYKKNNPINNYLNISLASFENKQDDLEGNIEGLIERSILQQIFYRVKNKSIPYSRFKKIKNISFKGIIFRFFVLFIWISSGVLLFKPYLLNNLDKNIEIIKNLDIFGFNYYNTIIIFLLFVISSFYVASNVFKFFNKLNLNRIKFLNGEIELNNNSEISILNKHLDEILYFFEVTDYNVVIIEDLDRFKNKNIFSKLREINSLINNSEKINRRVVFIYAIKDDMFNEGDRTKFFDFIIPVIPIINSSNSEGMLLKKLAKSNLKSDFSDRFISEITLYIDDMRMLENIYNEFIIYQKKLEKNLGKMDLNLEQLFSIIVYKNKYPTDFAKLQFDKGMIYKVFQKKNELKKDKINKIKNEIKSIKEKIEQINNEYLDNIEELRMIYLETLREEISGIDNVYIDNEKCSFSKLKQDEYFNKLKEQNRIIYRQNRRNRRTNLSFQDIENKIKNKKTYNERENIINKKQNYKIEELRKQLNKLNQEITEIKSLSLKQLINKYDSGIIFQGEINDEDLLKFLVRKGYIDEMYQSFITYFYPGAMTEKDMDFVLSVKNQSPLDFSYELNKEKKVINKLYIDEFKRKEVFNYDLMDFLASNFDNRNYKKYYNSIIEQLSDKTERSINFIDEYREVTENKIIFIKNLCNYWNGIWNFIELESEFPVNKKDEYLIDIIRFADLEDIKMMDDESLLSNYIAKKNNFLDLVDNNNLKKIKRIIEKLNIKFEFLNVPEDKRELFNFIYENDFYKINYKMIKTIFKEKGQSGKINNLKNANYTIVKRAGYRNLIKYIDSNINRYIENVFLKIESNNEEEEIIIDLLNRKEVLKKHKKSIIEKNKTKISNIKDVHSQLWYKLIKSYKIKINWTNLIFYYKTIDEIDEILINFLNQDTHYSKLSKLSLKNVKDIDDEIVKNFSYELIKCGKIKEKSFKNIVKSIPWKYEHFNLENISCKRIKNMVNYDLLALTNENIKSLKEKNDLEEQHIYLIEKNIKTYLKEPSKYQLNSKDIKKLLAFSKIDFSQKVSIVKSIDENIINDIQVDINLLREIIESEEPLDKKIRILTKQIKYLTQNDVTNLLRKLDDPYSKIAQKGKRPLIKDNKMNRKLAETLKIEEYISSISNEESGLRINTKMK